MAYDIVIKNGMVIDGSGGARYRGDIAIQDGVIARIGRVTERGQQTIDADGHVVTPGFVDGHTHMDAQVFWDPLGSCSSYHGVTTAVMGNCGFTLAPCRQEEADLVFRSLERAEDISRDAMLSGIEWRWETFPQFLDEGEGLGVSFCDFQVLLLSSLGDLFQFLGNFSHYNMRGCALGRFTKTFCGNGQEG